MQFWQDVFDVFWRDSNAIMCNGHGSQCFYVLRHDFAVAITFQSTLSKLSTDGNEQQCGGPGIPQNGREVLCMHA